MTSTCSSLPLSSRRGNRSVSNCIHRAEKNNKRTIVLGGLAASAPERSSHEVQNGCHDCISSGTPEEARTCYCDANPAALCSPTHATTGHVTSKAHTGNLTFLNPNLTFPSHMVEGCSESHMRSLTFYSV